MTRSASNAKAKCVALIGFRGCGKSAVGRELAVRLGGGFIDTDEAIATEADKSIAAIFGEEGEEDFRRREREKIRKIASSPPAVISVGGGAILDRVNVQALKKVATVVWLTAPAGVLWRRIAGDSASTQTRPALTQLPGLREVEHLLAEREPLYREAADITIDASRTAPQDIAAEIIRLLADRGPAAEPRGG